MKSRDKGQEPYLFELIRELFHQDASPESVNETLGSARTIGRMILIGVLILF